MRRRPLIFLAQLFLALGLAACAAEIDSLDQDLEAEQTADGLLDAPGGAGEVVKLEQATSRVCPARGHVSYTLERAAAPTAAQRAAYTKIRAAMDKAVSYYNCYTSITKALRVQYDPSVATADGNISGIIRFGAESTFEYTRAMHEIAHTVGIGTARHWDTMLHNGLFSGAAATETLRAITGKADDAVHADRQHFWPYGLNYANEVKSEDDPIAHCRMVAALRKDLGLL